MRGVDSAPRGAQWAPLRFRRAPKPHGPLWLSAPRRNDAQAGQAIRRQLKRAQALLEPEARAEVGRRLVDGILEQRQESEAGKGSDGVIAATGGLRLRHDLFIGSARLPERATPLGETAQADEGTLDRSEIAQLLEDADAFRVGPPCRLVILEWPDVEVAEAGQGSGDQSVITDGARLNGSLSSVNHARVVRKRPMSATACAAGLVT